MSIKKFHESYYVQVESITSGRASSGGIRQAIAAVGVVVLFPPPYSPDLNPIEKLFSKLKTFLRKAATGSTDELWE
jgi:transposase